MNAEILERQVLDATNLQYAMALNAYIECNDEMQEVVRDMLEIIVDEASTSQERHMALTTMADALFPNPYKGEYGMDMEKLDEMALQSEDGDEASEVIAELDREEATFAERLKSVMQKKRVTQSELAKKAGVGQPAISNMINRQCRPQHRTITRIAEALDVPAEDLWG